jgi:16S rRNA (cytidine1402-2'-O)-methyltransferase
MKVTLHILPNILAENSIDTIPVYIKEVIKKITVFYVEEIRSARRLLKALDKDFDIDACSFLMLNEHENKSLHQFKDLIKTNNDIGLLSEAGCAAVADPGKDLVELAHKYNVHVKPYVGPNSILMALMASGFNGQQFSFHGYLPIKQPMLKTKILELEKLSINASQLFIEVPYRNDQMIKEIVQTCNPNTKLCIASNICGEDEMIVSKTIADWKKLTISFHKKPAVFVLYSGE